MRRLVGRPREIELRLAFPAGTGAAVSFVWRGRCSGLLVAVRARRPRRTELEDVDCVRGGGDAEEGRGGVEGHAIYATGH